MANSNALPQLPQLLLLPVLCRTFAGEKKHPSHGGNPYSESFVAGILGGPSGGGEEDTTMGEGSDDAKAVMTVRHCFDREEEVGIPSPVVGALSGAQHKLRGGAGEDVRDR